ncbi:MAG: C39 family peptidase, partial [Anaerolineales bacterium]|nr:C39 family peptidase [Anaerolineales bacterium]
LHPVHLLPVPYVSQMGPGADTNRNDCGAACGLMVLKAYKPDISLTVDAFYRQANPNGRDEALWVGQIRRVLSAYGIQTEYKGALTETVVFQLLLQKKPIIALIHYGTLVDRQLTQFTNFRGGHFVVIIGMDTHYIYVHDPYSTERRGEAAVYPISVFWQAWRDATRDFNPAFVGFYPTFGIGEQPVEQDNSLYRIRITCNAQRVRSGPGVQYNPPLRLIYRDTVLPVYEEKDGWGRIGPGEWVYLGPPYNTVVEPRASADNVANSTQSSSSEESSSSSGGASTEASSNPPTQANLPLYRIQITCSAQRVRSGPGQHYPSLKLVPKNTILSVYEETEKWGRVGEGEWVYLGPPYNVKL